MNQLLKSNNIFIKLFIFLGLIMINIAFTTFEGHQLANQIANIIISQAGIVN